MNILYRTKPIIATLKLFVCFCEFYCTILPNRYLSTVDPVTTPLSNLIPNLYSGSRVVSGLITPISKPHSVSTAPLNLCGVQPDLRRIFHNLVSPYSLRCSVLLLILYVSKLILAEREKSYLFIATFLETHIHPLRNRAF